MKITVKKSELLNALVATSKVATDSKIRPILACVKLVASDKGIELTATDLEITLISKLNGIVEHPGMVAFKAEKVIEYVATLEEENIEIELVNHRLNIYEAEFETMDIQEYPTLKGVDILEEKTIKIDSQKLDSLLSVCIAVSKSAVNNPALSGVRLEISDKLRCIASDSFRMVYCEEELENINSELNTSVTIPNNAVLRVLDLIKNSVEVKLFINETELVIKTDAYKLTTRLITSSFPNWKGIISNFVSDKLVTTNRAETIKILKRILIFARENSACRNAVIFETDKNKIKVKAIGSSSKAKDKIEAIITGEDLKINLNAQFITEYINTLDCHAIEFKLNEKAKPLLISPCEKTNTWLLCMPVALVEQ